MAEKVHDIYSSILSKAHVIIERQSLLVNAVNEARAERDSLRLENERLRTEIDRLKADLEYMAVARSLGSNPQQIADSRALISGLVREIDRCIAELNAC
ncbi:MAG: hypothetical protein K2O38_05990 [Muribaculaceae bacterium]|nr:hypothetical protein [Muribaculaceae bacterium]MDE7111435.1 hypothetical protein [Muribaculaceae bacterium]